MTMSNIQISFNFFTSSLTLFRHTCPTVTPCFDSSRSKKNSTNNVLRPSICKIYVGLIFQSLLVFSLAPLYVHRYMCSGPVIQVQGVHEKLGFFPEFFIIHLSLAGVLGCLVSEHSHCIEDFGGRALAAREGQQWIWEKHIFFETSCWWVS